MHTEYLSNESAKHICACPSLLPSSLGSSTVSVYREYLSQWHSQFTPWGECLCVIQQPPRRVSALTTGTHHPLRRFSYFSRRSETSTASQELTQAFLHYVVLLADSFRLEQPSGARHAPCCESMITTIGFATQTILWRLRFSTFGTRTCTDWCSCDLSLQRESFPAAVLPSLVPQSSILFCILTNAFLKRLLRSKTKWQEDEWGKEVVVSVHGWGCFGWGGWKLTHPVSVHVWHRISPFTDTSEQMKTCYTPCFPSGLSYE